MKIHDLVFITTQTCNLNCKYCFLSNTKKGKENIYKQEQEKINQALIDKTYINNYLQALKRINQKPVDIEQIEIWGQEPTINLELFMNNFDYLYKCFPNIKKLVISTNGIQNIDKIIEAIKIINDSINKPFNFSLQFSYDGEEYTKINRGIDPNIIKNNVYDFIEKINKVKLKSYMKINMHFHGVLGKNLMTSLKTQEEIQKYWLEIHDFTFKATNLINNSSVFCNEWIYPAIETPINSSKEEGELIYNFLEKSLKIPQAADSIISMFENITKHFLFFELNHNLKIKDLIQIVKDKEIDNENHKNIYNNLSRSCGCGTQNAALKMDYKGDLIYCQNVQFLKNDYDFKDEKNLEEEYFYSLYSHNRYINILKDSQDKINEYFNFYDEYTLTAFGEKFTSTLSLMLWMADVNLISPIYKKNIYKLISHSFILSTLQNCPHNDIIDTGSVYGRSTGLVKTYANGVLSLLDDLIVGNESYKFNIKLPKIGE